MNYKINMSGSKFIILAFVISFIINIRIASAQQQDFSRKNITQSLMWIRYHNKTILSNKFEWQTHIDDRRFFVDLNHHHFIVRSQIFYHLNPKIAFSQGFVYGLQQPHDPLSEIKLLVPEYRAFQEILVKNDLGKVQIRHRYRLEERFVQRSSQFQLEEGFHFNWRVRYQFQAQRRMFKIDEERNIHFRVAQEIMLNFGKIIQYNIFDQSRFSAAVFTNLSPAFDLEVGYSHWYQQLRDGNTFYNRHIYRATLFHNIDLRKKKSAMG